MVHADPVGPTWSPAEGDPIVSTHSGQSREQWPLAPCGVAFGPVIMTFRMLFDAGWLMVIVRFAAPVTCTQLNAGMLPA
jgi:hypothetical protein